MLVAPSCSDVANYPVGGDLETRLCSWELWNSLNLGETASTAKTQVVVSAGAQLIFSFGFSAGLQPAGGGGGLPTSVRLVKDNPPRIAPHLNNPSQVYLEPRLLGDFRFCQVVSHANTEHYTFPGDRIIRLRWKLALSLFYLLRSLWPRLVPFCVRTPPPQSSQCH